MQKSIPQADSYYQEDSGRQIREEGARWGLPPKVGSPHRAVFLWICAMLTIKEPIHTCQSTEDYGPGARSLHRCAGHATSRRDNHARIPIAGTCCQKES